jgi:hypothetical protein
MKVSRRGVGALAGAGVLAVGMAVATGAGQASAAPHKFLLCNYLDDTVTLLAYFPLRGGARAPWVQPTACSETQAEPGEPFVVSIALGEGDIPSCDSRSCTSPEKSYIFERREIGGFELIVRNGVTMVAVTGTRDDPQVEVSTGTNGTAVDVRCVDLDGDLVDC